MIEIEEPPDIRACAMSAVPLVWLWSARSRGWKSYEPVDGDRDVIRRHRCERHGDPDPPWRQLELQHPSTIHAGAERVRRELEKAQREEEAEVTPIQVKCPYCHQPPKERCLNSNGMRESKPHSARVRAAEAAGRG